MMSRISFHDMACRIPFRIGIFFIRMLMCVLLCEHGMACALRWGVALVGVYPYWELITLSWDPLSGVGYVQAADPHLGP